MSNEIEVVFLGVNDAGMRVYDWLCDRSEVFVRSLLTTEEQLTVVEEVEPNLVVSCGYRHIVPESILDVPEMGCLNLHPAYLPYNRGANPNVWSIVEGTPAGVTLHYMDSTLDTGDIVARREVATDFSDTGKDLYQRLEDTQVELFQQTWPDVVGGNVSLTEQEQDEGTYHRTDEFKELCEIDGEETVQAKKFLDRLRALTFPPYDNAKIEVDGET
jgi:methionyl-tRNA formyltransferase